MSTDDDDAVSKRVELSAKDLKKWKPENRAWLARTLKKKDDFNAITEFRTLLDQSNTALAMVYSAIFKLRVQQQNRTLGEVVGKNMEQQMRAFSACVALLQEPQRALSDHENEVLDGIRTERIEALNANEAIEKEHVPLPDPIDTLPKAQKREEAVEIATFLFPRVMASLETAENLFVLHEFPPEQYDQHLNTCADAIYKMVPLARQQLGNEAYFTAPERRGL